MTPSGALVIDTPGMRELQLWGVEDGVEDAFADIKALAARCRFGNCGHTNEPGCAVRAALAAGELLPQRFAQYQKLKAEQLARAPSERKPSALANKPSWKKKSEGQQPFRHRQHRED